MSGPPALPARLPALDGLRALAILMVLVHTLALAETWPGAAGYVYGRMATAGWMGVQLFFVLSGFLITGILLDSRGAPNYYGAFYARRTLRIFPLYFGVLAVAFLVVPALSTPPANLARDLPHQAWYWTYLSNWAGLAGIDLRAFPHFWSLAVEEQFYLVWPLVIARSDPRRCLALCAALIVASLGIRAVLLAQGVSTELIYVNSLCRMDALAAGAMVAAAFRLPGLGARLAAAPARLAGAALAVFAVSFLVTRGFWNGTPVGATVGYTLVAAMFALWLAALAGADAAGLDAWWARPLRAAPLGVVGQVSYGMYVFHKPLADHVGKPVLAALGQPPSPSLAVNAAYTAAMVVLTFGVAWLSWHGYERHFLGLKARFQPRRATNATE